MKKQISCLDHDVNVRRVATAIQDTLSFINYKTVHNLAAEFTWKAFRSAPTAFLFPYSHVSSR